MSKLVKIVFASQKYDDYYGEWTTENLVGTGILDWEEVSDADYNLLRYNLQKMLPCERGLVPILVVQDDSPVEERIKSIRQAIDKYEEKLAKQKKKQEDDRIKREMQKEARELNKLQQLKKKYGEV